MKKCRTYHVVAEGDITTSMTAKELRGSVGMGGWAGVAVENEKVTVKRVKERAKP